MPFDIVPVTADDAQEYCELFYAAYNDSPVSAALYSVPASTEIKHMTRDFFKAGFGSEPNTTYLCVKDSETKELISFIHWQYVPQREGEEWKKMKDFPTPPGFNTTLWTALLTDSWKEKVRIMGSQPYVYLSTLITSPNHQGKGAGSMLIKRCIKFAESLNLPMYLTATPEGQHMYERNGFVTKGHYEIDVSRVSSEKRANTCMVRPQPDPSSPTKRPPPIPIKVVECETYQDIVVAHRIEEKAFAGGTLVALAFPSASDEKKVAEKAISTGLDVASDANSAADPTTATIPEDPIPASHPANHPSMSKTPPVIDIDPANLSPSMKSRCDFDWDLLQNPTATPRLLLAKSTEIPSSAPAVAFAKWYYFTSTTSPRHPWNETRPPGANIRLLNDTIDKLKKSREEYFGDREYAMLCILTVLPDWQKRQIGQQLLEETLKEVDEKGWECWLDASPEGRGLYKKLGWVDKEFISVDAGDYGGEKGEKLELVAMVRPIRGGK